MSTEHVLGIDIGGTGIKGSIVDVAEGTLTVDRYRLVTPRPATPEGVSRTVGEIVRHFNWHGLIGVTFPAVVKHGFTYTAANVDPAWVGANAQALFAAQAGSPVTVLNDADAAGIAEMTFGVGRGHTGVVLLITLGTGIGSALFVNGHLVPNTELGHIEVRGKEAEHLASALVREEQRLNWKSWARRLDLVLKRYEALFWPDLIIVGGGVSKKHERFLPLLTLRTPVLPATLLNTAGIVGAALAAKMCSAG